MDSFDLDWVRTDLSATLRVVGALAPITTVLLVLLVGYLIYSRQQKTKAYRDPVLESRGDSMLLGMRLRLYAAWLSRPLVQALVRTRFPANAVSSLSILVATAAAVALAAGRFSLGGWLYLLSGLCDFLDGRLARASGTASPRGAALDSVFDRYADGAVFIGLSWFYRDSWVLLATLGALLGSLIVPYIRARGEGLGVTFKNVGLMQRPERLLVLGLSVALSPVLEVVINPQNARPMHYLAVVGILLVAVATQHTAIMRLRFLLAALRSPGSKGTLGPLGKGSLFRTTVSAATATLFDFGAVAAMVSVAGLPAPVATFIGCGFGAVVNFVINRVWTFQTHGPYAPQAARYAVVSGASALLNSGTVATALLLPGVDYRIAWWLARGAVYLFWNFPLQRDFVFAPRTPPHPSLRVIRSKAL